MDEAAVENDDYDLSSDNEENEQRTTRDEHITKHIGMQCKTNVLVSLKKVMIVQHTIKTAARRQYKKLHFSAQIAQ